MNLQKIADAREAGAVWAGIVNTQPEVQGADPGSATTAAPTEFREIAYWLARTNPDKKLLPDDVDAQTRALEAMDYCRRDRAHAGLRAASSVPPNFAPNAGG